ncbi:MAG: preprotein translocase subunit SecG [Opitutus sp.]
MNILLGILTFVLLVTSVALVLVVLMQKAKNDGGLGAAMGGGMAEAAFGADTSNVLSKFTINAAIAFFVLAFALYLGRIYQRAHATPTGESLPTIAAPATLPSTAPATAAPATTAPATSAPASSTTPAPSPAAPKTP